MCDEDELLPCGHPDRGFSDCGRCAGDYDPSEYWGDAKPADDSD